VIHSIPNHPHQSHQSECLNRSVPIVGAPSHKAAAMRSRIVLVLERLIQEFQWCSRTLWLIGHNLCVHIDALLSKQPYFVDYGLSYEPLRETNYRLIPRARTRARIDGTDNLLKTHRWATPLEEEIYLLGFDQGERFALDTLGKQVGRPSALSYLHEAEAANNGAETHAVR